MSEEEKQEAFREEVRGYLAKDKATLDNLVGRVDKLEKTVLHGNGNPSLTTQVATLHAKMEIFSEQLTEVKTKVDGLDAMRADIASINAKITAKEKNNAAWIWPLVTIAAVVVVPFIEHYLFGR